MAHIGGYVGDNGSNNLNIFSGMVLGFKKKFPDGTETMFEEKILSGLDTNFSKIHTLREDVNNRWRKGMKIHFSTGVRTKKYNCFALGECTGVQSIWIEYRSMRTFLPEKTIQMKVDGRYLRKGEMYDLIHRDGLTENQFIRWFFPKGFGTWEGKIIHWTGKRY